MLRTLLGLLCVLFLSTPLPLRADWLLWLDGPQRTNPKDPKSKFYKVPLLPWQWSPTVTLSSTNTPLSTATSTISATPSSTSTTSPGSTSTCTRTITPSATPSPTATATATASSTATVTASATPVNTATLTFTPTASATPADSSTATFTFTATASITPGDSATSSSTPSPTASVTPPSTPTFTFTLTPQDTASPTYSATPSETVFLSDTPSPSYSASPSETAFLSDTPSPTYSPTSTETVFLSETPSVTPSATPTSSASPSSSATSTSTSTFTETPQDTFSSTQTVFLSETPSVTASATPTASGTPQDTFTSTQTPQDTASSTPSATPSITFSPSASPSPILFNGLWYDGETAGATSADGSGYASSGSISELSDGTGYGASTHYLRLTVSAASSYYAAGAWINKASLPQTRDVSSFTALELWWRIPTGTPAGNDFRPNLVLVGSSGQSVAVSATSYLDSQTVPGVNTWVHSTIPISAFTGVDLTTIQAISVQPAFGQYDDGGSYTGAVDLDNIQFTHASGLPLRNFGNLFSDFSLQSGASYAGTYWYTTIDNYSPCTTITSLSYPSAGKPLDAGGDTLSPFKAGHFAGHLGDGGSCANATYAQLACEFVTGSSVNLSDGSFFKTLTAGVKGMRFGLKLGSGSGAGQLYHIVLTQAGVTAGGADYYVQVAGSDLNTTSFTSFSVDFPAYGATPTKHTYGSTSELYWAQPNWATAEAWDDTGAKAVRVDAATRGADFDILVDSVEFY